MQECTEDSHVHIIEGFLPPVWAVVWTVVAAPFVLYGGRRTLSLIRVDARTKALVAVAAGYYWAHAREHGAGDDSC